MSKTGTADRTLYVLDYEFRRLKSRIENLGKTKSSNKKLLQEPIVGGC